MFTLDVDLQRVSEQLAQQDGALSSATMDRVLQIWFSVGDAGDGEHKCNECGTNSNFERIAPAPSELQRYLIVQARDYVFDMDEYRAREAHGQAYFGKKNNAVEFFTLTKLTKLWLATHTPTAHYDPRDDAVDCCLGSDSSDYSSRKQRQFWPLLVSHKT